MRTHSKSTFYKKAIKKTKKKQKKQIIIYLLLSRNFFLIFFINLIKCRTCIVYGKLFKEIGIYFIDDDLFVTITAIVRMLMNSVLRFYMGAITEFLGIKYTYFFNLFILILANISMINIGTFKQGFFVSLIINITRVEYKIFSFLDKNIAILVVLNYVTCVEYWGQKPGST